jgi:hypothetical protein
MRPKSGQISKHLYKQTARFGRSPFIRRALILLGSIVVFSTITSATVSAETDSQKAFRQIQAQFDVHLTDSARREKVRQLWAESSNSSQTLLERTIAILSYINPNLKDCSNAESITADQIAALSKQKTTPFELANLRLLAARSSFVNGQFETSQTLMKSIDPEKTVEPATYYFLNAAIAFQLFKKDDCLNAIKMLLNAKTFDCPRRYRTIAARMRDNIQSLQPGDLKHIAHQMNDISRRLDLGKSGSKVQKIEDDVIESLDRLIESLQKQANNQSGSQSANNLQPARPAEKTILARGKGPGQTTARPLDTNRSWGNLPPGTREQTLQQIDRRFPAHYREIIEQFFRSQAAESPASN